MQTPKRSQSNERTNTGQSSMYRSRNDTYSSGFSDDSDDAALSETDASHSCSHRGLDERGTSPWLSPRAAPPANHACAPAAA